MIIHILFNIHPTSDWWVAKWSAGEILGYVSAISLGLLAFWQNQKITEDGQKRENRNKAIETYAFFDFSNLKVSFIFEKLTPKDIISEEKTAKLIENGFNGNKAFWKFNSCRQYNEMKIQMDITNIGNYTATNLCVVDENGNKIEKANVLHSTTEINDKKYIVNGETGVLIIIIDSKILDNNKRLYYNLSFQNPFGFKYSQKLTVINNYDGKLIQIDTDASLNIDDKIYN